MEFDESVRIARPAAEVFARLADIQTTAVYPGSPIAAMDKIPPGPTTVGTQWREVVRLGRKRTMTMWSQVSDIQPGRLLEERFWGGSMCGTLVYTLTPEGGNTILRQHETMRTVGWLRPFGWIVGRMLRPRLHTRLLGLRTEFEAA